MQDAVSHDPPTAAGGSSSPWSRLAAAIGGTALVGIVFALDHATGPELAFSAFYVLPVGLVVWYGGPTLGLLATLVSAGAWGVADATARGYSHPAIHVWNTGVRLAVFLTVALLLSRLRASRDAEHALTLTDPLTGSANSRSFYERLEHEIARARRSRRPFGLVYFDLDGFKLINDRLGHLVGDRLLQAVADRARREVRATDLVARLGGDEFAVLLTDTGDSGTRRAVAKLRATLLDEMVDRGWPVTFSFGAATFHEPPTDARHAIGVVDELMYGVKASGKDAVVHRAVGRANPLPTGKTR